MPAIGNFLTNEEVAAEIGERIRSRRLDRNWSAEHVAKQAGVNRKTVLDLEAGHDVRLGTLIRVLRVLDLLGALENALPNTLPGEAGLSVRGQPRQRARTPGKARKHTGENQ